MNTTSQPLNSHHTFENLSRVPLNSAPEGFGADPYPQLSPMGPEDSTTRLNWGSSQPISLSDASAAPLESGSRDIVGQFGQFWPAAQTHASAHIPTIPQNCHTFSSNGDICAPPALPRSDSPAASSHPDRSLLDTGHVSSSTVPGLETIWSAETASQQVAIPSTISHVDSFYVTSSADLQQYEYPCDDGYSWRNSRE